MKRFAMAIFLVCVLMANTMPIAFASSTQTAGDLSVIKTEEWTSLHATMLGGNGLLFTVLLVGIVIGVVCTLLVQHIHKQRKK